MKTTSLSRSHPRRHIALALALSLCMGTAAAQAPGRGGPSGPNVRATAPLVEAGGRTEVAGAGFKPGQKITLSAGGAALNAEPYVADDKGGFTGAIAIPADAALGAFPVEVHAEGSPDSSFELKISRQVPLSGQDRFDLAAARLAQGLYQSAYSARSDAVYVTSAVGRPPVTQSELLKVDPKTLEIVARVTPGEAPAQERPAGAPAGGRGDGDQARAPGLYAVYGVAVDDANGTVWVTNTRQNTVAVYRQSDLELVRQFPVGTVPHPRDVAVDAERGRAYVSSVGEDFVAVFDTKDLAQLPNLRIASGKDGEKFIPTSLDLDAASGKLYTVGLRTSEAAVIDLAGGKVEKVFALEGARGAIGVAFDTANQRLLVASQGSDNLLVVDPETGKTVHDVYVGAGALNVAYEPVGKLAYVSVRVGGSVAVVDPVSGRLVANLDGGSSPNHVFADGKGRVFAVNKSRGADDPKGDRLTRITAHAR